MSFFKSCLVLTGLVYFSTAFAENTKCDKDCPTTVMAAAPAGASRTDMDISPPATPPRTPPRRVLPKPGDIKGAPTAVPFQSPVSKSVAALSPLRRRFVRGGYTARAKRKAMNRKTVRSLLRDTLPNYERVRVPGTNEYLYLVPGLFDPKQDFLTSGEWKTNQERMSMGLPPICYRAYVEPSSRASYSSRQIIKKQKQWVIQLHHLDQEMDGYGLLMIVPGLHMGSNWAYYIDTSGDVPRIIQSRITRDEADLYPNTATRRLIKNVLHPYINEHARKHKDGTRSYPSQIDREAFEATRRKIWRLVADEVIDIPAYESRGKENTAPAPPLLRRKGRKRRVDGTPVKSTKDSTFATLRFSPTEKYGLRTRTYQPDRTTPTKFQKKKRDQSPSEGIIRI